MSIVKYVQGRLGQISFYNQAIVTLSSFAKITTSSQYRIIALMSKLITIEQPPVTEVTSLPWITEDVLAKEPSWRRADPEFAYK